MTGLTATGTAGAALSYGDPVYLTSGGKYAVADADGASTYPAVGIAAAAAANNGAATVLVSGYARLDSWTWTPGGTVYLSTAAGLTQTQPSASGAVIQIVGVAMTATVLLVAPQTTYITHS